MLGTHDLWTFLAASFLVWLTPGPDTMYILTRSISHGRRAGVMSALGIGSGLLIHTLLAAFGLSAILGLAPIAQADDSAAKPYKILETTRIPAAGGIDYVTADSVNRRVYVACGNAVSVFDLDTYKLVGTLA